MHTQFSTTEIGSSPLAFGWKFESNPGGDPATDPPDNQGGGGNTPSGTEPKPAPEDDDDSTDAGS
jgi:hypothetical protein